MSKAATSEDVARYLARAPPPLRRTLRHLRATLRAAAPGAEDRFSYGMLALAQHDRVVVYYGFFSDHLSLFVASPVVRLELGPRLAAWQAGKGTLQIRPDHPIPDPLLREIVRRRLQENATKGRPRSRPGAAKLPRPRVRRRGTGAPP